MFDRRENRAAPEITAQLQRTRRRQKRARRTFARWTIWMTVGGIAHYPFIAGQCVVGVQTGSREYARLLRLARSVGDGALAQLRRA